MVPLNQQAKRVASIAGIEVRLHASLAIVFALIVMALGTGVLPSWHPEWNQFQLWATALTTGVLFFCSVLAHELSHALVAKAHGLAVPRITLFLFGGVAEMESEPDSPRVEFLVAAAGPAMSIGLSLFFLLIFTLLAPPGAYDPEQLGSLANLSAPATAAFWLASVNLILGVFNLIPGFPLDGGRLFRAFLWWRTGDQVAATRRAADIGRFFGWALLGLGLWRLFNGDVVGGAWLALIGWFLSRLATASVQQLLVDRKLTGTQVRDLMRTRFQRVDQRLPLGDFVDDYLLRSSQILWPVSAGDQDIGLLSLADISALDGTGGMTVGEAMQPLATALQLAPDLDGREALKQLVQGPDAPLPVVDGMRVVGLLHQGDILRWLAVHETPAMGDLQA
jgi:Zn-dependent protease/CBS domain-containing protein